MIEENMLRGSLVSSNEAKGALGFKGERGYSNYEIYVKNGGTMTEQEWLEHFGVDLTDYAKTSEVINYVGELSELETEDKTDIVSAINEHQSSIDALDEKTPVVLYRNPDGNNGTITLSDDVNNYEYIEIFYKTNDSYLGSKKIIAGNYYTELVSYQSNKSTDPEAYIKIRVISINNNTISTRQDSGGYYIKELMLSAGGIVKYENNYIYITRVLGYK